MYDAKNTKEVEAKSLLPKDSILDGVIIQIDDGVQRDFVSKDAQVNWKGNLDYKAINVIIEVVHEKQSVKIEKIFTYSLEDGKTCYSDLSNLGKYKAKYDKMPEVGDQVKVITNDRGFGKIKLD